MNSIYHFIHTTLLILLFTTEIINMFVRWETIILVRNFVRQRFYNPRVLTAMKYQSI